MCGFFGVVGSENSACHEIYEALISLQHRGQDAAGIVTHDDRFHLKKGNGLVRDVFRLKNMERLTGSSGIGQVRYPTFGGSTTEDAQPFVVNYPYGIAMAHNGNVTNGEEVKNWLSSQKRTILHSSCDVELILFTLAVELSEIGDLQPDSESVFAALKKVLERVQGAYSVATLISQFGMVAFRDPNGIRPMVMGSRENSDGTLSWACSSENIPLEILGYKNVEMIKAGEAVIFLPGKDPIRKQLVQRAHNPCIFEHVYFARPDSIIDDVSVYEARRNLGKQLANRWNERGLKADVVIPVPDSACTSASTMAQHIGVEYREGLVKNRYIGRTFIMPGQGDRTSGVRRKLNSIRSEFEGKDVLLVDDSVVRGTTSRQIVDLARAAGARKVFFASCSPPVQFPCVYGVDMSTRAELIAREKSEEQIAEAIGADAMIYQPISSLRKALKDAGSELHYCAACFDGEYPTPEVTAETLSAIEACRLGEQEKLKEESAEDMSPSRG
ncbi:MAG: amidophosphoribosyltransferase [Planctomycetia bacterium]|jgi:amidophosphoribosyltransferase|nr:amidophosphoribosyltransferase [Planctomycetia bacterium]NCG13979.1 amidophosphoribosyltransferase [Planctomycetia bacterium]NCG56572.1 amidophosphoribosyltransferase [Pseudomonadota bacterium]